MKQISLTQGKYALVDDENYEELNSYYWRALQSRPRYWIVLGSKNIPLAKFIMRPSEGMVVDHIDSDPFNNQRNNLRICTPNQNHKNRSKQKNGSSQYIGVQRYGKRWIAIMTIEAKQYHLGIFSDEQEVAKARDRKAFEAYGEFAKLNFPNNI